MVLLSIKMNLGHSPMHSFQIKLLVMSRRGQIRSGKWGAGCRALSLSETNEPAHPNFQRQSGHSLQVIGN